MSDEMRAEPVAWPDLLKAAQEIVKRKAAWRPFIDGTPLENDIAVWMAEFAQKYAQSPSVARAMAIAECARIGRDLYKGDGGRLNSYDEGWNDGIDAAEQAIRALSSPPSVSEEWVEQADRRCLRQNARQQ